MVEYLFDILCFCLDRRKMEVLPLVTFELGDLQDGQRGEEDRAGSSSPEEDTLLGCHVADGIHQFRDSNPEDNAL